MTRQEYLDKLRRLLRALPPDEIDAAVSFYEEYLDDAEDEAEALAALGHPREAAGRIAAEIVAGAGPEPGAEAVAVAGTDAETPGDGEAEAGTPGGQADDADAGTAKKRGFARTVSMVILAVFALPVGLPVAAAIAAAALAVIVSILAVIAAAGAAAAAMMPGGLVCVILGAAAMTQNFALGLAALGTGLAGIGVGWLLLRAIVWLWKKSVRAISRFIGKTVLRRTERGRNREQS
ncbi:MAG: hypothetical protein LBS51_04145 [Oscillospiraceae bacterium]|jgi:uncharacterized membrane protein|nr:hypothetical protein [Oscillospiraceae bacterium]